MSQVVYPIYIDFEAWVCHMKDSMPLLDLPNPTDVNEWREWAASVVLSNTSPDIPSPDELIYPTKEDWRRWANYFNETINT